MLHDRRSFNQVLPGTVIILLVSLLPLFQIGLSYYASVQVLALIALALTYANRIRMVAWTYLFTAVIVALIMCLALLAENRLYDNDIPRRLREAVLFLLLSVGAYAGTRFPFRIDEAWMKAAAWAATGVALVVAIQLVFLTRGTYVGLPKDWFITNTNTLPDILDLIYSRARPFGTFGEPSYLGFFALSLLTMFAPVLSNDLRQCPRAAAVGAAAALFVGLASQSLAFLAAFGVLLAVYLSQHRKWRAGDLAVASVAIVAAIIGVFYLQSYRLSNLTHDESLANRILLPFRVLPDALATNPVGASFSGLLLDLGRITAPHGGSAARILDTAFTNLFFSYGFVAAACLALLFIAVRFRLLCAYLLVILFFNGGIFTPDKVAVVLLVCWIYTSELQRLGLCASLMKRRCHR